MLPDQVSNPGPLTYESGALPIALCGPARVNYMYTAILTDLPNDIRAITKGVSD